MSNKTLSEDIGYLRTLAQAGERAPLLGGRFLAWWGGILTLAYTGHYLIVSGMAGLPINSLNWLWLGMISVALGGFFFMLSRIRGTFPGSGSVGNRVEKQVWKVAGITIGAMYMALVAKGALTGTVPVAGFSWSLVTVLALYAVALSVSGAMAQNKVLSIAGYGAIFATGATVAAVGYAEVYLVTAAAMALTVFLPGLLLLRAEPSQIV